MYAFGFAWMGVGFTASQGKRKHELIAKNSVQTSLMPNISTCVFQNTNKVVRNLFENYIQHKCNNLNIKTAKGK